MVEADLIKHDLYMQVFRTCIYRLHCLHISHGGETAESNRCTRLKKLNINDPGQADGKIVDNNSHQAFRTGHIRECTREKGNVLFLFHKNLQVKQAFLVVGQRCHGADALSHHRVFTFSFDCFNQSYRFLGTGVNIAVLGI